MSTPGTHVVSTATKILSSMETYSTSEPVIIAETDDLISTNDDVNALQGQVNGSFVKIPFLVVVYYSLFFMALFLIMLGVYGYIKRSEIIMCKRASKMSSSRCKQADCKRVGYSGEKKYITDTTTTSAALPRDNDGADECRIQMERGCTCADCANVDADAAINLKLKRSLSI